MIETEKGRLTPKMLHDLTHRYRLSWIHAREKHLAIYLMDCVQQIFIMAVSFYNTYIPLRNACTRTDMEEFYTTDGEVVTIIRRQRYWSGNSEVYIGSRRPVVIWIFHDINIRVLSRHINLMVGRGNIHICIHPFRPYKTEWVTVDISHLATWIPNCWKNAHIVCGPFTQILVT